MKKIITSDIKLTGIIRNNGAFNSEGNLKDTHHSYSEQCEKGDIVGNGILMAEQNNKRLKNADNRFALYSISSIQSKEPLKIKTLWQINSYWDFDSFEKQAKEKKNLITELPLGNNSKLQIPDGLSAYLAESGLASPFDYSTEWEEEWPHA
jgi:hypothetical protein